ncbi:MAG: phosphotransferase [Dehalococcoidia bacterium]|nr:phosphotransferase [Dehalococcoidia bacterium]
MEYEPPIDREALLDALRDAYEVEADALAFVPVGYANACYAVHVSGEPRHFLKLWSDSRAGRWAGQRRHITLPLLRALYDRGLYRAVAAPLPARDGALSSKLGALPFALFPFLPGHGAPEVWPPALTERLAEAIAAVHRATPHLQDLLPPRETFEVEFEPDLRSALDAVVGIEDGARPGLVALRDFLLPRRDEVLEQLGRLHELRAAARRLDGPSVLAHTDIGGDNVLVDASGGVALLDWDTAVVAPPEHDLQCALGQDLGRFLAAYLDAGGARPLHREHFAFYLLRRYLTNLFVRLFRILEEETAPEAEADALDGMHRWGFAQWQALDESLERAGA